MMSGEKVICRRVSDGVLINIPHTFDLKQIADSGQCFRLTALQDTIDFVGGSTQELVFHTFFSQNKKPFDLSSCTASFALINFVNKNGSPLIAKPMEVSKSEDGDGTVTNVLRVVLLPEETVDLVGKFIYQITIQDISGEIEIPDQGIIRIANNINKSFPH